ncbi:MAG: 50S ribosomal protein L14 [Candidatus Altiarchaeota archaeon]|nr:50S ribosomal protein L14 [Candidatus Altiarchaeota archaeon]
MVRRIKAVLKHPPAMRTIRALPSGARMPAVCNSGAKIVEVISVIGFKATRGQQPVATIGDMIVATVKKGAPDIRKKVVRAIIVQTKQKVRRADGNYIHFEQNGAVVVDEDGNPKGTEIKGPVAREAVLRWPGLGKIASVVV